MGPHSPFFGGQAHRVVVSLSLSSSSCLASPFLEASIRSFSPLLHPLLRPLTPVLAILEKPFPGLSPGCGGLLGNLVMTAGLWIHSDSLRLSLAFLLDAETSCFQAAHGNATFPVGFKSCLCVGVGGVGECLFLSWDSSGLTTIISLLMFVGCC